MRWVPFTASIRVVPARPGKRVENTRALQRLAVKLYNELITNTNLNIAGSGQQDAGETAADALTSSANAVSCKPQMGETPAQLVVVGFYKVSEKNTQTQSSHKVISGGEFYDVYTADNAEQSPVVSVDNGVKALKTALLTAMSNSVGASAEYDIFRIDYAGVVYGDRGYTFPR